MMKTRSKRLVGALRNVKFFINSVLLLLVTLFFNPAAIDETWGQSKLPRVGILTFSTTADDPRLERSLTAFRQVLADRGWVEGKNIVFEIRNSNSDTSQFAAAAAELVDRRVDVILATSAPALRASYEATRIIPIVALDYTTDPVAKGYVLSYSRPGKNVTGVFLDAPDFAGKWFELLRAMIPGLTRVAVVWDPSPGTTHLQAVRSVTKLLNIELQVLEVRKPDDIDNAFDTLQGNPQAIVFLPSPMIHGQNKRLARLALKHQLPATSMAHAFADAGGLIAYGPELTSTWQRNAILVAKILSGGRPAILPLERPTRIELVVNQKTAKALGLTIPESIQLRADEVIR